MGAGNLVSGIKFEPAAVVSVVVVNIISDPFSTAGVPVVDNNTGPVEN